MIGIIFSILSAQSVTNFSLGKYQWQNRLILIFAPSKTDSTYQAAQWQIKDLSKEFIDRDIVIFHLIENGTSLVGDSLIDQLISISLREDYHIEPSEFKVILIGKDGGEKLRQKDGIDFKVIFNRIDAMPMRRSEMQKREKKK
jgi:hypothetical protein